MPDALTQVHLKDLVRLRLKEAHVLFGAGLHDGCCYLCGYVIELALKAAACRTLGLVEYPVNKLKGAFRTHSPEDLLLLSGLSSEWDRKQQANATFAANWLTLTRFGPDQRYSIGQTEADARQVLDAVTSLPDGVLEWLSQQW